MNQTDYNSSFYIPSNNQIKMTQKIATSIVDNNLDNTKITSIIHYRTGQLSDATRIYRKEELLKKKLRSVLDLNGGLQSEIKTHQNQIRDERASIAFQMHDLTKQMSAKFGCFTEQRLERTDFINNQSSHRALQDMMTKYQKIEQQCLMMRKIFQSLEKINDNYINHSKEMQELVLGLQVNSREYEEGMENTLGSINQEIKAKLLQNADADARTQQLVREIDQFIADAVSMKQQESKVIGKIQKLKKMASKQQQKVDEIKEWAEIVIDKNNRKAVYRTLKQKQEDLDKMKLKNTQLEIYLSQLCNEERNLLEMQKNNKDNKASKENRTTERAKTTRYAKQREDKPTQKRQNAVKK